jgi:Thoeris protein ThsB, TIR-like domain
MPFTPSIGSSLAAMTYRNKTFVSFASEDIRSYRLMQAWRANENIEFNFHDAHDLNTALDASQPQTIRRRLRERLANTKQVVLLIGDTTRSVAGRPTRFLYYEVEIMKKLDLPVVFANLCGSRKVRRDRLPAVLEDSYTMSVPFRPAAIKLALDDFAAHYSSDRRTRRGPHRYPPATYYFS